MMEGYSAGWASDTYLTIPGSARERVTLYATPEEALDAAKIKWPAIIGQLEVKRVRSEYNSGVTVTHTAYRIIGSES